MTYKAGMTFLNIPVKDLPRSTAFFKRIGFGFSEPFTDETAACMIINDNTFAMLQTEEKFRTFIKKDMVDASRSAAMIIAVSADSRAHVDELMERALAAGGKEYSEPADYGFMYYRCLEDLDGHLWEFSHFDMSRAEQPATDR